MRSLAASGLHWALLGFFRASLGGSRNQITPTINSLLVQQWWMVINNREKWWAPL
jgi:hypothetical protein